MSVASVPLNSGRTMPLLGLGCWLSGEDEVVNAVSKAIDCGYRLIDTAYLYKNERGVGEAIRKALASDKLSREDIFVVTKLPLIGMHVDKVEKYLRKSLTSLGLDYVDLYLIHCPVGCVERSEHEMFPEHDNGKLMIDPSTDHIALWHQMEHMVKLGLTRDIGVSNFSVKQMMKIIANARIPPAVNQVEMHVWFQQKELQQYCKEQSVVLMSYGTLGSPGRNSFMETRNVVIETPNLLNTPVVRLIAEKHRRTPAQILLRFFVQQNIVVIPKSVRASRIEENGDLFSFNLSETDMDALKYIDQGESGRSFRFGKIHAGFSDHPEATF